MIGDTNRVSSGSYEFSVWRVVDLPRYIFKKIFNCTRVIFVTLGQLVSCGFNKKTQVSQVSTPTEQKVNALSKQKLQAIDKSSSEDVPTRSFLQSTPVINEEKKPTVDPSFTPPESKESRIWNTEMDRIWDMGTFDNFVDLAEGSQKAPYAIHYGMYALPWIMQYGGAGWLPYASLYLAIKLPLSQLDKFPAPIRAAFASAQEKELYIYLSIDDNLLENSGFENERNWFVHLYAHPEADDNDTFDEVWSIGLFDPVGVQQPDPHKPEFLKLNAFTPTQVLIHPTDRSPRALSPNNARFRIDPSAPSCSFYAAAVRGSKAVACYVMNFHSLENGDGKTLAETTLSAKSLREWLTTTREKSVDPRFIQTITDLLSPATK